MSATAGWTKRTLENLSSLHRKVREKFEAFLLQATMVVPAGVTIEVISGLRSYAVQQRLYDQGRKTPGRIVTNAKPGSSWHNYGLAMDLGLFRGGVYLDEKRPAEADKIYAKLGALAKEHGIEWAGEWISFQETPHFQYPMGYTLATAREKLRAVNFDIQKL